ncbi:MAG: hypothetical protein ACKO8Q_07545 [Bacteroidota bacterium]
MKKQFFYLLAVFTIFSVGCKVDEEFDGPSLNDLYGDFVLLADLDISNRNVDFSQGQNTFFSASFSKNVNWKIEVKGLSSGAVKRFEGFTNSIDASNCTWNGTTTDLPMFKIESCAVELTMANIPDTLRDTLQIIGSRIYNGFTVADFENGWNPGWSTFVQSGANMSFAVQTNNNAAQGNRYYEMAGTVSWDWLIGLVDMPGSAYGSTTYNLTENASNLYFNTMVYKPAGITNGLVLFQLREDDNGDGMFSEGSEDMYSIQVQLTEDGWSQISQRYDQIP